MHEEDIVVVEIGQKIFGAARQGPDAPTFQPRGEPLRKRKAQIGAALFDAGETCADHRRLQTAPHRFDLG
jgi:hypothetical protein